MITFPIRDGEMDGARQGVTQRGGGVERRQEESRRRRGMRDGERVRELFRPYTMMI